MKPFPIWYIRSINALAKQFNFPVEFDKETATYSFGRITLTAPGGEGNEESSIDWIVGTVSITHGVRYTKNGDGWPDEIDWSEDSKSNFYQALRRAGELLARELVDSILESAEYEELAEREEAEKANFPFSGSF